MPGQACDAPVCVCVSLSAQVEESSCSPARWTRAASSLPEAEVTPPPPNSMAAAAEVNLLLSFQLLDRVLVLSQQLYSLQVSEAGPLTPARVHRPST